VPKIVDHFEVGKYYQFTGHILLFDPDHPDYSMSNDYSDIWFWENWMDRKPRKCTGAWLEGTSATFEDLFYKYSENISMPWRMPASYDAYLKRGMFQVEVL